MAIALGSAGADVNLTGARVVLMEQLAYDQSWSKSQLSDNEFSSSLRAVDTADFSARLYLIESGEDISWGLLRAFFPHLPARFFEHHHQDQIRSDLSDADTLFAKWARPVKQTRACWDIERNMVRGKCWDIDTAVDPEEYGMNHLRYEHWPPNSRRYEPTRLIGSKREVRHSLRECASFFSRRLSGKIVGKWNFDLYSYPSGR